LPLTWVFALILGDFIYYWWHRASHRINFMWAGHVIHHQSEEYNLSTALRQSWITQVTAAIFFLPMAVIGIPFEVYFGAVSLNLLYQFWIHTRVIKKMGPFEWVFNTPSHHRVHHGVNPEYLDKNYAGILIIWDRMFGTFIEEEAEVIYGTVKPIQTWNPIRNNLEYWMELGRRSVAEKRGFVARIKHWFAPPEWG
jgi:alkylglycerol monooxygenase